MLCITLYNFACPLSHFKLSEKKINFERMFKAATSAAHPYIKSYMKHRKLAILAVSKTKNGVQKLGEYYLKVSTIYYYYNDIKRIFDLKHAINENINENINFDFLKIKSITEL